MKTSTYVYIHSNVYAFKFLLMQNRKSTCVPMHAAVKLRNVYADNNRYTETNKVSGGQKLRPSLGWSTFTCAHCTGRIISVIDAANAVKASIAF